MTEQCRSATAVQPCSSKYFERSALFRAKVTFLWQLRL
jgi:hypothetical protein